jgi:hypothetical protein
MSQDEVKLFKFYATQFPSFCPCSRLPCQKQRSYSLHKRTTTAAIATIGSNVVTEEAAPTAL